MNSVIHFLAVGIIITGSIYCFAVLAVFFVLKKVRRDYSSRNLSVTVVIAARNERRTIGTCLALLASQNYPSNMIEVIVVDDRSTDGTADVIKRFQPVLNNLSCIRIETVPRGISPKKNALTEAICRARGEIILQTDADCIPPVTWISGMVSRFEEGVAMVAGVAPYFPEPGILNSFVRHEYLWNAALSAASIALGHGTHASGRNLAFRRDIFEQIGGYGPMKTVLSGDDTLLLQRFRNMNSSSVVTMPVSATHVKTHAPQTFISFVCQRIRHMSTGRYFGSLLIVPGIVIYGFHLLMVTAFFLSAVSKVALLVFLLGFLWKCVWDSSVAWRTKTVLELDVEWRAFLLNELLLSFYMAFMPVLGLMVQVKWKENS